MDPDQGKSVRDTHEEYRPEVDRQARALITRIQQDPSDVEAIRELQAHYVKRGDQASAVNLMEGWGDTLSDPKAAADAYLQAADAALLSGSERTRARALYERVLSRDATNSEALDRVLRLLEDASDYARVKQVLKYVAYQLEEQAADPRQLALVQYRLGQTYELRFDEPGKAVACYRKAIEADAKFVPALAAARRIYTQVGNSQAVALLYELEVEAIAEPDDKRALLSALAELRHKELDDLNGAIVALRRALKLVPADVQALRSLGEALVARSERSNPEDAEADRRRAAEVFYQLARAVPRADARSHLQRALQLSADHERAHALLLELSGHGREATAAGGPSIVSQSEPQAELDARATRPATAADVPDEPVFATESAAPATPVGSAPVAEAQAPQEPEPPAPPEPVVSQLAIEAGAPEVPAKRDAAAEWLGDADFEHPSAVDTSELLPVTDGADEDEFRPSSLPPELLELHEEPVAPVFPSRESLRAPRMPSFEAEAQDDNAAALRARRASVSNPPPPPPSARSVAPRGLPPTAAGIGRSPSVAPAPSPGAVRASQFPAAAARLRSVPPAAPRVAELSRGTVSRFSPPPAYAEIPSASSDDFGREPLGREPPSSGSRRSRPDPTLIAWHLPADSEPDAAAIQPAVPPSAAPASLETTATAQPSAATATALPSSATTPSPGAPATGIEHAAAAASTAPAAGKRSSRAASGLTGTVRSRRADSSITPSEHAPSTPAKSVPPRVRVNRESAAPSARTRSQDERVSALSRAALEQASARRQSHFAPQSTSPTQDTPVVAAPAPSPEATPASSAPSAVTPPVSSPLRRASASVAPSSAPAAITPPPPAPRLSPAVVPVVAAVAQHGPTSAPTPAPYQPRASITVGEPPRDATRAELEVNVGATTDSNFYVGFESRLDGGGLFVATYNALSTGTPVSLLVTLPGNFQGRVHGRVRLTRDSQDPFGEDVPGMCVEFEAMSQQTLALFERFALKRTPTFLED